MLLDEFKRVPGVQNYHMAFRADPNTDRVVFLY
jgi:DNA mismatch repair protein MSH6